MKLSVVILNYNVRYFLYQCIRSVQAATRDMSAEIIVVDNNSTDDSLAMIRENFPSVKLIANSENLGFPKGNNIGVAAASGEYICILNPDTVVAEDTFTKVLDFADAHLDHGIIGCKLIDGSGNFLPESKRGVPTPYVALTKILGLYKLSSKNFGKYYASHLHANQSGKVDILVGAFMIMKREVYIKIGGFDENCFMYSDDIDLSYMVLKAGYENYYFAGTTVIHYKGESTVRDQLYMQRFSDAMNFFYQKHFKVSSVFNVFMKSGAFLFALAKRKKAIAHRHPQQYLLISHDDQIRSKVENLLGNNVGFAENVKEIELNSSEGVRTEIIFDTGVCSYKSIIKSMENQKDDRITFKILHADGINHFLIGSNDSNDRGEVKLLPEII